MNFTVWVTRPKASSAETIQKLTNLGVNFIHIPLLQLSTLSLALDYNKFDIIVVTSMHAAAHLSNYQTTALIAVVGHRSAEILSKSGIKVWRLYENVAALIADAATWPQSSVLYLRGQNITHNLYCTNFSSYSEHIVYNMTPADVTASDIDAIKHVNCVLVYSKRSGLMISKILKRYAINTKAMHFICISTQAAYHLGKLDLSIAAHPNEAAMVEILQTIISSHL